MRAGTRRARTKSGVTVAPEELIDRSRYPVTDLEAPATKRMIATEQRRLADAGVSILPGFLTPDAVRLLCREADELAPQAHFSEASGTPYLERPDRSFAEGHPRRFLVHSALRALAYDRFPSSCRSARAMWGLGPTPPM